MSILFVTVLINRISDDETRAKEDDEDEDEKNATMKRQQWKSNNF